MTVTMLLAGELFNVVKDGDWQMTDDSGFNIQTVIRHQPSVTPSSYSIFLLVLIPVANNGRKIHESFLNLWEHNFFFLSWPVSSF